MSNRQSVLIALKKHGQQTYDDLEQNTGIVRNELRLAVNDAKKAGHIVTGKDEVTGQPAHSITPAGNGWLVARVGEVTEPAPNKYESMKARIETLEVAVDVAQETIQRLESEAKISAEALARWEEVGGKGSTPAEVVEKLADREERLVNQRKTIVELQVLVQQMMDQRLPATLETIPPAAYLVATPRQPMRRFVKLDTATAAALSAARAHGQAEVFEIYPVGKAIRGAEWKRRA